MISSLLINFVLFGFLGSFLSKYPKIYKLLPYCVKSCLVFAVLWLAASGIFYLVTPLFFDHAESAIASVGAFWLWGGELYTPLGDMHRYSILYGPMVYLTSAFFQTVLSFDPIVAAKLAGVSNLVIIGGIGVYLLKSLKLTTSDIVLAMGCISLTLLSFYNMSYWNRPDSFLTSLVFVGLLIVHLDRQRGNWWAYLTLGILAGISVNYKVHGFLYFLPLVALFFESSNKVFSTKKTAVTLLLSLIVALGPFFLRGIDLELYIMWLQMATRHGLLMEEFVKNLTYIGSFFLLLYLLGFHKYKPRTFITAIIAASFIALLASKPGSGTPQFLPFIPVFMWWSIVQYRQGFPVDAKRLNIVFGAFLIMLSLNALNKQKRIVELFNESALRISEYRDLKRISLGLSGPAEIGYTSSYESSFYKPLFVSLGGGLLLESSALMDMKASGIDIPEATILELESCKTKYFIFPAKGGIWSKTSFYDDEPLFDAEFVRRFKEKYHLVQKTEFYHVYSCKPPTEG